MNKHFKALSLATLVFCSLNAMAQEDKTVKVNDFVHKSSSTYEWPTDPQVVENLKQWQDLKFGVLFHWGLYAVNGMPESWTLCSEDQDWMLNGRKKTQNLPYDKFKEWYFGLSSQFMPTKFEPADWAKILKDAGFKYMLFTTKHHDGFCMFDSKYTDYNIAQGPYKNSKYSNVAYHLFEAVRAQGLKIGTYFSKADWHCPYYWDPNFATGSRNPNYSIEKHPDTWRKFQEFTANQIDELMSDYGKIDILWLDAGWVRKSKGQDIKIDDIVTKARQKQPGLIVADRTVPGKNENYITPERKIPATQLNYPWESNIPLTGKWGWKKNATYKSSRWVINTLSEVVAKGGCFALGIGPSGDGTFEKEIIQCLDTVGTWLKTNGEAIYRTHITPNYHSDNVWFTANKDGKILYAIYALPEGEELPENIEWEGNEPSGKMTLLQNGKRVKYTCENGKVKVTLPQGLKNEALAFSFKVKK